MIDGTPHHCFTAQSKMKIFLWFSFFDCGHEGMSSVATMATVASSANNILNRPKSLVFEFLALISVIVAFGPVASLWLLKHLQTARPPDIDCALLDNGIYTTWAETPPLPTTLQRSWTWATLNPRFDPENTIFKSGWRPEKNFWRFFPLILAVPFAYSLQLTCIRQFQYGKKYEGFKLV